MSSAETTGIHMLYRFILDLAMLNVGAAINATTAGGYLEYTFHVTLLSLKLWKEQRYGEDDEKRRKYGSQCDYAPSYSRRRYPIKMDILTARMPVRTGDISRSMKSSLAIHRFGYDFVSINGTMA